MGWLGLLSHSVKKSGLAIRNPVDTAEHVHETSKAATSYLVRSMIDSNVEFDIKEHRSLATEECARARQKRLKREQELLDERSQRSHAIGRRDERNKQNGCWLTVIPLRVNGTDLSANEFRDNIRLRYNFAPLDMPQHCDGCGAKMTVEHALQCKVGGLVHARHDDVADEFRDMCGQALSYSKVEREPRIYSGVSQRNRAERGDASAADGSDQQNNTIMLQTTSLRNVVMLGARDFGTIVGWLSLMFVSLILTLVPTGTKTLTKS